MTNAINSNYFLQYQNAGQLGKQAAAHNLNAVDTKNALTNYAADATVEISNAGRNALQASQGNDESKLSAKAQSFLAGLREKYGDYNFVVSDNLDTAQTAGSDKEYSVIFTTEELEQMADDDYYAQKVMGQVGDAVDMLKNIWEQDLGEGVQFAQLGVSFDSEGNMKLFAQLEKLSADQKERLDAALEKRAEERKAAEEKAQADDEPEDDGMPVVFKSADVEAESPEELFNKIFSIDWRQIPEQETVI